jgi:hypothetical protein
VPSVPWMRSVFLRFEHVRTRIAELVTLGLPGGGTRGNRSGLIGPISLIVKGTGARSAGNPHATCVLTLAVANHQMSLHVCQKGRSA